MQKSTRTLKAKWNNKSPDGMRNVSLNMALKLADMDDARVDWACPTLAPYGERWLGGDCIEAAGLALDGRLAIA
jgi:hypothetical protein